MLPSYVNNGPQASRRENTEKVHYNAIYESSGEFASESDELRVIAKPNRKRIAPARPT